jgi:uncharacterized membrane protein YbhN (UPF0104 family)
VHVKRPWRRRLPAALVLTATAVVLVANRRDLPAAWRSLRHARAGWVAVALGLAALGLADLAVEHAAAQRAVGLRPRLRTVAPRAWAARFLNLVAKSGGMAGVAVFRRAARRDGQPEGRVVAGYLLATVLDPLAFAAVLAVALVVLAVDGKFTRADAAGGAVFLLYLAVTVGVVTAAIGSRDAVRTLYAVPSTMLRRLGRGRGAVVTAQPDNTSADELFESVQLLRRQLRSVWQPALAALGTDIIGVAQLWAVLGAVGGAPRWRIALVAYSVSTLFGIVGLVPAGLGFVEVSLAAVLVSSGIAVGSAAAAVVLYRVAELWVPLAVGALVAPHVTRLAQVPD